MKTKHTPTPWRVAPDNATIHCGSEHDPEIVCTCDINDPMALGIDEQEANAQFIVQACNHHEELVEALEFLAPRIGSMLGRLRYSNTQDAEMLPKIKSLLTKLKGQP